MSDLNAFQLSSVQTLQQPGPNTIASTTTIAPSSFITYISGTTDIATITPFVTGQHMAVLIFTASTPGAFTTAGNIKTVLTTIAQNIPVLLFYNPVEAKYYHGNLGV